MSHFPLSVNGDKMKCDYWIRELFKRGGYVDKHGNIYSQHGRKLSDKSIVGGYRRVQLSIDGKGCPTTKCRILCYHYHGEPPTSKHEPDHIDRNKLNDSPDNLRWVTHKENCDNLDPKEKKRRIKEMPAIGKLNKGGHNALRGEKHSQAKLTEDDVLLIRQLYKLGNSIKYIAEDFSIGGTQVYRIVKGVRWGFPNILKDRIVARGSKHHNTKLTEKDVKKIRRMCKKGYSQLFIAERYGVGPCAISNISIGKTWKHVS